MIKRNFLTRLKIRWRRYVKSNSGLTSIDSNLKRYSKLKEMFTDHINGESKMDEFDSHLNSVRHMGKPILGLNRLVASIVNKRILYIRTWLHLEDFHKKVTHTMVVEYIAETKRNASQFKSFFGN